MKHHVLLSLIIYGLVIAGLGTRNGGFLVLAIPVMVYLAAGLFYEPEAPQLKIDRHLSADRVVPGQVITVTLTITNDGPSLEEVHLVDNIPPALEVREGNHTLMTGLTGGQTVQIEYSVLGKRGLYRFLGLDVTIRDYLGLSKKQFTLSTPDQFLVLPEIVKVKKVAIRPPHAGIYAGLIPARQGGPGIEFFGVREYRAGDPLRRVNERASARHQHALFVNEFEQERVVDVGLILDARRQSDARQWRHAKWGWETLFEYGVQATATLTDTFLDGGNRVGLFIYGRSLDWTFPSYGKVQRERIIRALARAKQGDGKIFERLDHLPTRLFPVQSQLVLISPLLADDWDMLIRLRARGYRLLIISPDPVAFERKGMADSDSVNLATLIAHVERELLLTKLREAEIQVVDWPVEVPFHQVAQVALSRLPFYR